MERYKEYKDSGVQWIGEIPSHWDQRRVRYTGKSRNGLTYSPYDVSEDGEGILVLRSSNIQDGKLSLNDNVYVKKDISPDLMVKKGDILICSRNGSRDLVGKLTLIDKDLEASFGAFMMIYRTNMWAPFMEKVLSVAIQSYKTLFSTSTINQLTNDIFKDFVIPLPPLSEQEKIVSYIESKTSKIDEYIAEKEKEVQLLNELKEAEIAKVVTQGLNPNVKMKDSGVSWIGMIPEHWDIRRLSQVAYEHYISNKEIHHQNLLSLSYGKIIRKDINTTEGLLPASFDTYQIVEEGNVVMRLTDLQNDHKSLRVGLVKEEGIVTSAYVCLGIFASMVPSYLYNVLHSYDIKKLFYSMGGGLRQNLNWQGLKKLDIPVPPKDEQRDIVSYINGKCEKITSLVSELEAEIEHLKEYKQRLIADCVTGQVNVQNETI